MVRGMRILLLLCTLLAAAEPVVVERVDWPAFLSRSDLVWDKLPTSISPGPAQAAREPPQRSGVGQAADVMG